MPAISNIARSAAESVRRFVDPQRDQPEGYVYSSSKLVTGLLVVAAILYPLTNGWGTLVALALAIFVLLGRRMLERQVAKDVGDLNEAKRQFKRTRNQEYLTFITARCTQLLNDNKVLTPETKTLLHDFLKFAERSAR